MERQPVVFVPVCEFCVVARCLCRHCLLSATKGLLCIVVYECDCFCVCGGKFGCVFLLMFYRIGFKKYNYNVKLNY